MLGDLAAFLTKRNLWAPVGICPSVGLGGFLLGGGISPYVQTMGLGCDRVTSVELVDAAGHVSTASRRRNATLFSALCGSGGAQFGIVTTFTLSVARASSAFGSVVNFRFVWPYNVSHAVLAGWAAYAAHGSRGSVWSRVEIYRAVHEPGLFLYGSCYKSSTAQHCLRRLLRDGASFMNVPGRVTIFLTPVSSVAHAHACFGPNGDWGRRVISGYGSGYGKNTPAAVLRAFEGKRGSERGHGDEQVTQSIFVDGAKVPAATWKRYVNFCKDVGGIGASSTAKQGGRGGSGIGSGGGGGGHGISLSSTTERNQEEVFSWIVCMLSPLRPPKRKRPFPFYASGSTSIMGEFIIGGGHEWAKRAAYFRMRSIWKRLSTGVYVNYPERFIGRLSYPAAYWGDPSRRAALGRLKALYDPHHFFSPLQPIPVVGVRKKKTSGGGGGGGGVK